MEAHKSPSVFNFYQPDFSPSGPLSDAGLYAPEAGLATAPLVIGLLNGLTSLVESGLSSCNNGFGSACANWRLRQGYPSVEWSDGRLEFAPQESNSLVYAHSSTCAQFIYPPIKPVGQPALVSSVTHAASQRPSSSPAPQPLASHQPPTHLPTAPTNNTFFSEHERACGGVRARPSAHRWPAQPQRHRGDHSGLPELLRERRRHRRVAGGAAALLRNGRVPHHQPPCTHRRGSPTRLAVCGAAAAAARLQGRCGRDSTRGSLSRLHSLPLTISGRYSLVRALHVAWRWLHVAHHDACRCSS